MKSLNQRIFLEVLNPMFPDQFGFNEYMYKLNQKGTFRPNEDLDDAFWLAEKVGLFDCGKYKLTKDGNDFAIFYKQREEPITTGKTPQEAICKAILEIYGKKDEYEIK